MSVQSLRDTRWRRWLGVDEPTLLVRFALLRLLGIVYLMAFLVAALQGPALIGENGLLPASAFLERVVIGTGSLGAASVRLPTLFWLGYSDATLLTVAWIGVALSLALIAGMTNALLQALLWVFYISIANIGQRFYGYGWESQLLETGFLSIFLCPLRRVAPFASAPPFITVLLYRWLIARIMLGAGLIKIRGDDCWTDLTCLVYHYETQPIPNPFSPIFHAMPEWFHRVGVVFNHLVELAAPLLAFGPRRARIVAGALFVSFQGTLILSGNLSFLNWLTIVPALACFDDRALAWFVPRKIRRWVPTEPQAPTTVQIRIAAAYAVLVAVLSLGPIANLLSSRQAMNTSFDPLRLVNTYGAFGSVTKVRHEVIVQGTADEEIGPNTVWREYEFPCKPGAVDRRPCWISPYHHRLDWQLWFAGFNPPGREYWIVHLVYKLLTGDRAIAPLIAEDPFGDEPPRWVRVERYRYELLAPDSGHQYWRRSQAGTYLPPMRRDDRELLSFMDRFGWPHAPD